MPTPNPSTQDAVFKFLGDPATHGGAKVRCFDTHAAAVFLAGDRALKVKRAVRFPFLDYSTLDRRKAACTAEIEVNRRFAPQLYRRVVPITREPDGRLALGGVGEAVEWAVEMLRFDENQTLDHVAEHGALDNAMAARLAVMVATMHQSAERVDAASWIAALGDYIAQNTAAFRERGDLFAAEAVSNLDQQSRATLQRLKPLLAARGRQGLVRRGHGDLHLANIAVLDGEPIAFDAIEFDPVIAAGDVLYDLAFLLMDLVDRDLVDTANIILNGYFVATQRPDDCDGLAALPFFMSLRAAIRAKVTAARLRQAASAARQAEIAQSAQRYFQLALDLLQPARPSVICTGGLSGTGKSMLARSLAPQIRPVPGALILRSDVERKAMFGVPESERLPADAYRTEVSEAIYAALNEKALRVARAGYSVIVDAVFARSSERDEIERAAHEAGATFHGLFLVADLETRVKRIGQRGLDASDADAAVARQQEEFDVGRLDWATIDASGSPEQTLAHARAAMRR